MRDEEKTRKELIAELQQLRAELATEKALSRTLMDNIPDSIYVKDTNSRFLIANQSVANLMGVEKPEILIGKKDGDFLSSELSKQFDQDEKIIFEIGNSQVGKEELNLYPSGEEKWVSATKVPLRDDNDKIIGLVGINRDITKYKRTEIELKRERNLFYAVIDHLPDQVYVKDLERRFIRVSQQTAQDLGLKSPKEMIGKRDEDYLPKWRYELAREEEEGLIRTGKPVDSREVDIGDGKWLFVKKAPLKNENGEIVGLVGVNRDITKLKLQEATLEKERKLLRTLIDTIPDYIYVKGIYSQFIIANKTTVRLLGATDESQLIDKTDFSFFPPEYAAKYFIDEFNILQQIEKEMVNKEEEIIDIRTKKKGWLSTTKVALRDDHGQIIGILGIGRDVTQLKEALEQAKMRAEQLEALRKTIVNMASSLELKPLLNSIVAEAVQLLGARSGGLYQYSPKRKELKLVAEKNRPYELGDKVKEGQGIAGRLVQYTGHFPFLFVPNYNTWAHQISEHAKTGKMGAVLAVLLEWQGSKIGVLYVEYSLPKSFRWQDTELLRQFANYAAIAIQNATSYANRTDFALRGMGNITSRHSTRKEAINIRDALSEIQKQIKPIKAEKHLDELVYEMVSLIDDSAQVLIELNGEFRPLDKDTVEPINIYQYVKTEQQKYSKPQKFELSLDYNDLDPTSTIVADPNWLSCVFHILIMNAEEALLESSMRCITISVRSNDRWVEMDFIDTGNGIPENLQPLLFKDKITHDKDESRGMGLLMADLIIKAYQGEISLVYSNPSGTCIRIRLPIKQSE